MRPGGGLRGELRAGTRRFVVGVTLIAVVVIIVRGVPSWDAWRESARAEAISTHTRLAETRALIEALPPALDSLESRVERLQAYGSRLLVARGTAAAERDLMARIQQYARGASVELGSVEAIADTSHSAAAPRIVVNGRGAADLRGLRQFLHQVEAGPTDLSVSALHVTPEGQSAATQPERLSFRFAIEAVAFLRPDTTAHGPT